MNCSEDLTWMRETTEIQNGFSDIFVCCLLCFQIQYLYSKFEIEKFKFNGDASKLKDFSFYFNVLCYFLSKQEMTYQSRWCEKNLRAPWLPSSARSFFHGYPRLAPRALYVLFARTRRPSNVRVDKYTNYLKIW